MAQPAGTGQTMTIPRKHRCGGTLQPQEVEVRSEEDGLSFHYRVPGLICDKCHEELVERDAVTKIQRNLTPTIWFTQVLGTYPTRAIKLDNVLSSTPGVVR